MKKRLRCIIYVSMVALVLTVFAGCSGGSGSDTSGTPQSVAGSGSWDEMTWDQNSWE